MTNLKFDTKTISVLKSFSLINPSMLFKEGNEITTVSPTKTIMARANVATHFDKRFAVYSLNKFLNTMSMFSDPEINVGDSTITITDVSNTPVKSVKYTLADENTLPIPTTKEPNFPEGEVKFTITNDMMKDVERALSILSLPEIAVVGDGISISIQALDSKNPSGDVYSVEVGLTDKTFKAIFKPESFNVLSKTITNSYDVEISSKGFSHFKSTDLEYWIAIEATSTFN